MLQMTKLPPQIKWGEDKNLLGEMGLAQDIQMLYFTQQHSHGETHLKRRTLNSAIKIQEKVGNGMRKMNAGASSRWRSVWRGRQ